MHRGSRTMAHTTTTMYSARKNVAGAEQIGSKVTSIGHKVIRYGLALVIGWIGCMKFTGYEVSGIEPLIAQSPFLTWVYRLSTVRQFSDGLGVVDVAIAILIALRPWSRKACVTGSALAVLMFLTTFWFLPSAPRCEPSLDAFPAFAAISGQFLFKDVVLLGAAIWSLGEALTT
jgi:uncharacterized membrane protein YkgB